MHGDSLYMSSANKRLLPSRLQCYTQIEGPERTAITLSIINAAEHLVNVPFFTKISRDGVGMSSAIVLD